MKRERHLMLGVYEEEGSHCLLGVYTMSVYRFTLHMYTMSMYRYTLHVYTMSVYKVYCTCLYYVSVQVYSTCLHYKVVHIITKVTRFFSHHSKCTPLNQRRDRCILQGTHVQAAMYGGDFWQNTTLGGCCATKLLMTIYSYIETSWAISLVNS